MLLKRTLYCVVGPSNNRFCINIILLYYSNCWLIFRIRTFRFHCILVFTFQTSLFSVLLSMSRQAAVHSSRLRYSHPSLGLPPCFHRLHEPHSSCIHTSGCPCLPWHCQPHLVEVRYGGCPSCLSRSSRIRLARYRFPSTSPSLHSQCLTSNL